jgi:uncharacterized membrane protein
MTFPVPHVLYVLLAVLPPLTLLVSIPLILGWVKPNPWYGVRTRKTRSSPGIWYRANRMGGICLALATLIALALWALLLPLDLGNALRVAADLLILAICDLAACAVMLARVAKM